ncbi:MarR family winged helix-turn-helix transcriptional regulator [Haloechinothrix sp. LS1_15]|uniref:MarR family winged helix-turn-helix transcriptional regulator n=1 Tax=Haloechinothrix sp. LS1_15 TaxID=2652248 RepID=UPI002948B4DD|nr:MarR family winged helix-turn-helix transcriptional regulator [Haloechinothrix sp. LS1_15]MDV6013707.1 winged helix-turn-helix transcriptional regulator [Haloechinothrix sp. LS1_15]
MEYGHKQAVYAWEALFRSQVTLLRRFKRSFRSAEISLSEYDVLYNLTLFPGSRLRLNELNEHVLLAQPSLSRLVERMEADGLVRRERDPTDGRGTVVVLTEHGSRVQRRVGRGHAEAIAKYVGGALDEEELRTLERLCDKLRMSQPGIPE